jgi:hypothetical protein
MLALFLCSTRKRTFGLSPSRASTTCLFNGWCLQRSTAKNHLSYQLFDWTQIFDVIVSQMRKRRSNERTTEQKIKILWIVVVMFYFIRPEITPQDYLNISQIIERVLSTFQLESLIRATNANEFLTNFEKFTSSCLESICKSSNFLNNEKSHTLQLK